MASTKTTTSTLKTVLDQANPNELPDALAQVKLGTVLAPLRIDITGLTATAALDITSAMAGATVLVNGVSLGAGLGVPKASQLPPILILKALQVVTSGTATSLGSYIAGLTGTPPAGCTPLIPPGGAQDAVGIASLSDDGKTLTFPNTVTGISLQYMPQSNALMSEAFGTTGV